MENNLYTKLDELNEAIHKNHLEVCQRLTALETNQKGLPERVSILESDKARLTGGWSVGTLILNLIITCVGFLFRKHP